MSRIRCNVEHIELDGDYGAVDGVRVTCSKCGHQTESFGVDGPSIRRCLALMNEECECGQSNFYVAEGQ